MHGLQHQMNQSREMIAARGILAVLFGLAAVLWPSITLQVLVVLVGVYILSDGFLAAAATIRVRGVSQMWWVALLEGLCGIAAGLAALFWPGMTALALVIVIGAWSVITGVIEIVVARALRREIGSPTALLPIGILSLLLGLSFLLLPHHGTRFLGWLIGLYAIAAGILLIRLAIRLHVPPVPSL